VCELSTDKQHARAHDNTKAYRNRRENFIPRHSGHAHLARVTVETLMFNWDAIGSRIRTTTASSTLYKGRDVVTSGEIPIILSLDSVPDYYFFAGTRHFSLGIRKPPRLTQPLRGKRYLELQKTPVTLSRGKYSSTDTTHITPYVKKHQKCNACNDAIVKGSVSRFMASCAHSSTASVDLSFRDSIRIASYTLFSR
jgi:hypothetical protein